MNLCANKRLKGAAAPSLQTPPDAGEGAAARGAREVPAAPRLLHAPLGGPQLCSAHADETSAPIAGDRPRQHPEGPALQGAPAPQAFIMGKGLSVGSTGPPGGLRRPLRACAKATPGVGRPGGRAFAT